MTRRPLPSPSGTKPRNSEQPGAERWVTGRRARLLLCVSGVSFMIMLDSNIVAVSLPSIARDLHASFSDVEWVVSAYVLTFAAFLLPAGALADRLGRRRMLFGGLLLFAAASLLCGLAPSPALLNGARAAQGVGAAVQLSASLAILGHAFRGRERARAFAFWGTVMGVAVAAGPVAGGLITSYLGWRWAFLVNVPFGVIMIVLGATAIDESRDPSVRPLDFPGMVLFGAGLFGLVWGLISANSDGWTGALTLWKFGVGGLLLLLFAIAESVQKRPMIEFDLFKNPTFLGGAVAMLGFASAAQVMMTFLPLYLQNVYGLSPAYAGLGMLPFALPLFICPRLGGHLATRISGRTMLTIGLILVACGDLAAAAAVMRSMPYPILALGMIVLGCGAGLLNGETAKVQMSVVPPERGGMASGIAGTLRFVGLVTGITGLGAVLATRTQQHFETAASGSSDWIGSHAVISRIIAGDIGGVAATLAPARRAAFIALGQESFASGFSTVLFVAAGVALVAALLTLTLVSAHETAPPAVDGGVLEIPAMLD